MDGVEGGGACGEEEEAGGGGCGQGAEEEYCGGDPETETGGGVLSTPSSAPDFALLVFIATMVSTCLSFEGFARRLVLMLPARYHGLATTGFGKDGLSGK